MIDNIYKPKKRVKSMEIENKTIPDLLTQTEAAELLKKNPRWLERKRWAGGGPEFRYVGRSPRYEKQALVRWYYSIPSQSHTH